MDKKDSIRKKRRILLIGAVPPPLEGMAVSNANFLFSKNIASEYSLIHLNTRLNQSISNISKISFWKTIKIAIIYIKFMLVLLFNNYNGIYMPVSGSTKGLLRDMPFVMLASLLRKKIILHYHASYYADILEHSGILKPIILRTLRIANANIVQCQMLEEMLADFGIEKEKIHIVSNGVRDINKEKKKRQGGPFKVLFLSNLFRSKGFFDLLMSVDLVQESLKNEKIKRIVEFIFVGEFKSKIEKEEYHAVFNKIKHKSNILLLGVLTGSDKDDILMNANVFVLPSYSEAQPFSIMEAQCFGLPVIATDVGCIPEMVHDKIHGYIIEKCAPQQIADKIMNLLKDEHIYAQMCSAARQQYLERFTYERYECQMLDVLHRVIGH